MAIWEADVLTFVVFIDIWDFYMTYFRVFQSPLWAFLFSVSGIVKINLFRFRRKREKPTELWRLMEGTHCDWWSPGTKATKHVMIQARLIRWHLMVSMSTSMSSHWSVQLTMRLERGPKSWSRANLEDWYDGYHDNEKETRVDVEMDGSRVVFQSKDGVLAKAQLTQGCQVWFYFWQFL